MATSGPRSTRRPGAGPGRGSPRARAGARAQASRQPVGPGRAEPEVEAAPAASRPRFRASSLTTRAIALTVVLLILTISYANSLRIYFAQEAEIAATRQEIATRQAKIAELERNLGRWEDPAYVTQQARTRLGWVLPGETGYRVIGPDGKPLGGTPQINPDPADSAPQPAWWAQLWGSVEAADQPAAAVSATPSR